MLRDCLMIPSICLLLIVHAIPAHAQSASGQKTPQIVCAGRVTDSDGQPISKARVLLYYNHSKWGLGNRIVEEAESAADGTFVFERPLNYSAAAGFPYHQDSFVILATHPDYALGWRKIDRNLKNTTHELILHEPVSHTITVTDHAGNPLAGARVWPYSIGNPMDSNPEFEDYLSLPTDDGIIGSTTGADGTTDIDNLPRTTWSFYATLDGYARGLSFTGEKPIRLSKAGIVRGSVLTQNGEPVAGALIRLRADWMWQFFLARTDSHGKFHFDDLPAQGWDMGPWGNPGGASGRYTVGIEHESYTTWENKIALDPGQTIDNLIIDALGGTLIKCHVLEVDTDRPVGGARINGRNECGRIDGYSDPNGMFAIRILPGKTTLKFYLPPEGVYIDGPMRLRREDIPESYLDFEAEGDEMTLILRTPRIAGRLTSIRGAVLGPDGKPHGEAAVHAATDTFQAARRGYIPPVGVDKNGRFELRDVPAGCRVYIYAAAKDGTLAGTGELDVSAEPGATPPVQVKLRPTQKTSAVIKDQTGFLLSNTRLRIGPIVKGHRMPRCEQSASTDEQGLLAIDGILPGLEYYLQEPATASSRVVRGSQREPLRKTLVLIPGEFDSSREPIPEAVEPGSEHPTALRGEVRAHSGTPVASLLAHPLPDFEQIDIEFTAQRAKGLRILACLWDMEQRPSRNCVVELAKQAEELKQDGVTVVGIQVSSVKKNMLHTWVRDNGIPFPIGLIRDDAEKVRSMWAARSLPWLILTDSQHIVTAEGFGLSELDEKMQAAR